MGRRSAIAAERDPMMGVDGPPQGADRRDDGNHIEDSDKHGSRRAHSLGEEIPAYTSRPRCVKASVPSEVTPSAPSRRRPAIASILSPRPTPSLIPRRFLRNIGENDELATRFELQKIEKCWLIKSN